ncbi:MAG: hypothetical protein ACXV2C_06770 [Candidatus Bathyarchaeia archaeon]
MNVKELRELLTDYPDDMIIVVQADAEGNGYSPLAGAADVMYVAESTWSGTAYEPEEYKSEIEEGYVEEGTGVKALCVWPTN